MKELQDKFKLSGDVSGDVKVERKGSEIRFIHGDKSSSPLPANPLKIREIAESKDWMGQVAEELSLKKPEGYLLVSDAYARYLDELPLNEQQEQIEQAENAETLREAPHILHPAGGLTENFVYEPIAAGKYAYRTRDGQKGLAPVEVEFEEPEKQKRPHWFLSIAGTRYYFFDKPPKEFLFKMPDSAAVEKWVKDEKQSLTTLQLWRLNSIYLRTFLDFPHAFEFSVVQLFIQQSWLAEILPVVFYLGIKGEFGGGKTVTGEAVANICRHGYLTGNLSPPFVARSLESQKLTLMVDELDTIAKTKDSDLNSIFRQGYRRGVKYSRVNPDTLESESYEIFGPKLFTVHSDIEEALQTRTVPIHVRETGKPEYPIVNLDKAALATQVYTENWLWYMDNILSFRDNELHLTSGFGGQVDMVDLKTSELNTGNQDEAAEKIRKTMFEEKRTLLTERQLGQLCQLSGRNIELMYLCFILSNITKIECDEDIVKTFNQKIVEEGERMELGHMGVLKEVLISLYHEKKSSVDYRIETGLVKISNKEIYDNYNAVLKKQVGEGVSPAKFKEYMLGFGFTDALNRVKLKVPLPDDPEPKPRLCNIFTERVLRKLGIEENASSGVKDVFSAPSQDSLKEKLEEVKAWLVANKDSEGLVDSAALATKCVELGLDVKKTVKILLASNQIFEVPALGKWGLTNGET